MCSLPSFLPEILNLDGEWETILEKLYNIFKNDFIDRTLFYQSLKVIYDKRIIYVNKEEAFWHLITKDERSLGRIPDYPRAKRLPWARPIIENWNSSHIRAWDYLEGDGRVRVYLWLENYDYAIVLEKNKGARKHLVVLVTAFYVEGRKKQDLMRRYQKRIQIVA